MAKDPALLWYFNDWMGGTATMSRHLKGCYIDLLCVQFNSGKLSLEEIKTVLGSDFGSWPALQKKFKFENNLYFNERLEDEKNRRIKFTESRRKNAKHMPEHMEDRNENTNTNEELPIWLNKNSWNSWKKYKSEKGKKLTPIMVERQIKLLEKNKNDHIQIIENSITNGWTGLFPLKKEEIQRKPLLYFEPNDSQEVNERKILLKKQAEILKNNIQIK